MFESAHGLSAIQFNPRPSFGLGVFLYGQRAEVTLTLPSGQDYLCRSFLGRSFDHGIAGRHLAMPSRGGDQTRSRRCELARRGPFLVLRCGSRKSTLGFAVAMRFLASSYETPLTLYCPRPRFAAFRFLVGCLSTLFVAVSGASAQDQVVAKTEVYHDSDQTTVVRPSFKIVRNLGSGIELGAAYSVDAITTASIDVMTQATASEFSDRRKEISVSLDRDGLGMDFGASYTHSTESDYRSDALAANFSRDVFSGSTTLSGRLGYVRDTVFRILDPQFERELSGWGYTGGISQVISPTLVIQANYEGAYFSGFQQSPYRWVRFGDFDFRFDGGLPVFEGVIATRRELHPEDRLRHAISSHAAWYLGNDFALQPAYQIYFDDWGITSHELSCHVLRDFGPHVMGRVGYRYFRQGAADFYERQYVDAPGSYQYFSVDKRLGPIEGHLLGMRFEYGTDGFQLVSSLVRVGFDAKVDWIFNRYLDYLFLDERSALVGQFGFFVEL